MAENGTGDAVLSNWQARFVAAVLETPTITEAAERAGISQRTAWRYLADDNVKRELHVRRDAILDSAARRLSQEMDAAMDVLHEIMSDKTAADTPRVSAARAIMDAGLKYVELANLAGRVATLENKLAKEGEL